MKKTKRSLLHSGIALLLCIALLIGSTFAWFTDNVSSNNNVITSGNLDLEMYWTDDLNSGEWYNVEEEAYNTIFNYDNWEPGYTDVKYIKLVNVGKLALNYELSMTPQGSVGKLAEVINVYYSDEGEEVVTREDLNNLSVVGLLNNVMEGGETANGTLLAKDQQSPLHASGEKIVTLAMSMITTASNDYQDKSVGDFTITALASQAPFEEDAFGSDYDALAEFPVILKPGSSSASVTVTEGKVPAGGVTIQGGGVSAFVPEGTLIESGVEKLTLTVTPLKNTTSDITVVNDEILIPVDVHIEGVAENNTVPIIINLGAVLPKYLNMGNYHLFHVEDGNSNEMTLVDGVANLTEHNQYTYDMNTGDVSVAMATFSEVTVIADTANKWNGYDTNADTEFSAGDGTEESPYVIANADQLAYLSELVSNDNDNYGDKYYRLISDINLGEKIWYPIGYRAQGEGTNSAGETWYTYGGSFKGTFDGDGHKITGIRGNTWGMDGNYGSGYYKEAMGLFGYVNGGTVKNLTVDNFESDGEFTPTGVLSAYAANANFKNIAVTNSNPRVYNTGNGGIIGVAGNSSETSETQLNFTNVSVDQTNKISALWGSWDVACGGIMGMFRGYSSVNFDNCHVAAQIDAFNDVCGNYQYYWYRYSGMMIGSLRGRNITNDEGYTVPDLQGIKATACTVAFDSWNDYYYCELVDNTLASYTHDHQFSRLELVESVDTENKQFTTLDGIVKSVPTSGRSNYVVLDGNGYETENATCYHFKDGEVWSHEDGGYETTDINGDGVVDSDVLKEDKQHYYLPFNQVFQGDGWGVKHVAIEGEPGLNLNENEEYSDLDIQILERGSIQKFGIDEDVANKDFLFRVGNGNAFSIGKLFAAVEGADINKTGVFVSVTSMVDDVEIIGSFELNEDNWNESTLKISGTGPAKITIQDYTLCQPTELIVEVVDATNITSATGTTTGGDFVLLCDVEATSYVYYWDSTLYGNGFTYSLTDEAPTNYSSSHGHGILITKNATLDNLVIVGDVYDEYGAYTNNNDYNAAIDVMGETTIQNCYISGCSAPVSTRANAKIVNTTLYGGAVANLIIKGGTVTLEDVTTANYDDGRYDEGKPIGMGIVVHSDAAEGAQLILNGTLTQYNFIYEGDTPTNAYAENLHNAMFADSCSQYHFGSSPDRYVNTGIISLTEKFDQGQIEDNANTEYVGQSVSASGLNGYVYTQPNTNGSVDNGYDSSEDSHVSTTQGAVPPAYEFDYETKNYVAKEETTNDYCYKENGIVYISMDDGDTFNWDTSILTVTKGEQALGYTVTMNGTDYTGKSIAFNTAGNYEVVYTYTDNKNYALDEDGNITTYSKTYSKTVYITVAVIKETTKHAEFTMGSSNAATEKITVDNVTYISATGVTPDNSTWTYMTIGDQKIYYPIIAAKLTSTKGSSSYAYFPVFENAVTITDYADEGTGEAFTYNSSNITTTDDEGDTALPTPVKGVYKAASDVSDWSDLTNSDLTQTGATKIFKWASSSTAPSDPETYSEVLCYKSPEISADRAEYITLVQYSYTDAANTTYYYYVGYTIEAFTYQACFTPDTLITLADGSQKRVDSLSENDKILAWDFFTGDYAQREISLLVNHGESIYEVANLEFSDGEKLSIIGDHGVFDYDLNQFVYITVDNMKEYEGHRFVKYSANGSYDIVTLINTYKTEELTSAWSITSAGTSNAFASGLLTAPPPADFYNWIEMGGKLTYDVEQFEKDVATYGLYTYEDFKDYATYDQFVDWNAAYLKIAVEKGYFTFDYIVQLIETYKGWMV